MSRGVDPALPPALPPALLTHLVDDAAVFPPGSSPLEVAVADHLARLATPLSRWTGPLLVPAADAHRLPALVATSVEGGSAHPLRVGLVARPGVPAAALREGVDALAGTPVEVVSVELGWSPGWREARRLARSVVVELPREGQADALADVVAARDEQAGDGGELLLKWRTGATPTWHWPDARETAAVLAAVVAAGLPLKLTGGLHHALPGDRGTTGPDGTRAPDPQHGLLGVLVAVADALAGDPAGTRVDVLAADLRVADAGPLLDRLRALTPEQVARVRDTFRSYGCCTVTDPLGELADLGVLPRPDEGASA